MNPIPLDAAQALKGNSRKLLSDKYGELGTAMIEGQKALERGIKEEMQIQFPEIGQQRQARSRRSI